MRRALVLVALLASCKRVERYSKVELNAVPSPASLGQQPAPTIPQPEGDDPAQEQPQTGCVADRITTLTVGIEERSDCTAAEDACLTDCQRGSAPACFFRATKLQTVAERGDEALELFARACELGSALACTNYAAAIWTRGEAGAATTCARAVFDKACAVKEPYACGMIGRMIITHAADDAERTRGREFLERVCQELSGPPCKMLANHLQEGNLGPVEPAKIKALLTRACEGGDPSACDDLAR